MEGKITISRPAYSDDRKKITISVKDVKSVNRFIEIEMDYADFAAALTGLSEVPITFETKGLEYVGKSRIVEKRSLVVPKEYSRKKLEEYLTHEVQEEGWTINPYLGSQRSVEYLDTEQTRLNYSVTRYE